MLEKLLAKREELLLSLRNREDIHIDGRKPDVLDEAIASASRVLAVDKVNRETELLKKVKKAIDKFINGEFGECEECGCLVPEARLNVVPWAELCLGCQEAKELQETI